MKTFIHSAGVAIRSKGRYFIDLKTVIVQYIGSMSAAISYFCELKCIF